MPISGDPPAFVHVIVPQVNGWERQAQLTAWIVYQIALNQIAEEA